MGFQDTTVKPQHAHTRARWFLNIINVWICLQLHLPSTLFSFRQSSGESEWDGTESVLLLCRGCSVWVATITREGGERRKKQHKEEEEKGKERKRRGVLEGNVRLEFTQRVHCVFRSATAPFYELYGVFSDRRRRSFTSFLWMNGERWRTPLRCADNDWGVASLPPPHWRRDTSEEKKVCTNFHKCSQRFLNN